MSIDLEGMKERARSDVEYCHSVGILDGQYIASRHVLALVEEVERLKAVEQAWIEEDQNSDTYAKRLKVAQDEVKRLKTDRDRFQAIVHAVSPYLDPACLGLTPEMASEALRRNEDMYKSLVARIEAALAVADDLDNSVEHHTDHPCPKCYANDVRKALAGVRNEVLR